MVITIESVVMAVIMLASRVFDVPGPLIAAVVMVESGFNLHAVGDHDGDGVPHSFGPMMLNDRGAGAGWPPEILLNWQFNIILGTDYLRTCLNDFPNNKKMALAAYRQGPRATAYLGYGPQEGYVEKILDLEREFRAEWAKP